jgi:mediator of RNA polymerase II transcription subunit 22
MLRSLVHLSSVGESDSLGIGMSSDPIPQTDVSRPSALPTANLLLPKSISSQRLQQSQEQNSTQYLDDIEEDWNKKVDVEIETLVDGMVDIVSLASVCPCPHHLILTKSCGAKVLFNFEIGDKDKFRVAQEAFQTQCRAESMVKMTFVIVYSQNC